GLVELVEGHLRLDPVTGAAGPRARIVAADRRRLERTADAEAVAVAVVVGIERTLVVARADAVAVGVDALTERRAALIAAVREAVVTLLAAVQDAVAARLEPALVVAAVAGDLVAVVALLARVAEAVAAGRRLRPRRGHAHELRLLCLHLLVGEGVARLE